MTAPDTPTTSWSPERPLEVELVAEAEPAVTIADVIDETERAKAEADAAVRAADPIQRVIDARLGNTVGDSDQKSPRKRGRPRDPGSDRALREAIAESEGIPISKQDFWEQQRLAEIPKAEFESIIAELRAEGRPVGSGAVLKRWRARTGAQRQRERGISIRLSESELAWLKLIGGDNVAGWARQVLMDTVARIVEAAAAHELDDDEEGGEP
jgi:hypothetical protein